MTEKEKLIKDILYLESEVTLRIRQFLESDVFRLKNQEFITTKDAEKLVDNINYVLDERIAFIKNDIKKYEMKVANEKSK